MELVRRVDSFDDGTQAIVADVPGMLEMTLQHETAKLISSSTDPKEIKKALTKQAKAVDNRNKAGN